MDRGPIPDFALTEHHPVGLTPLSLWQRFLRKVYWGHPASYRRAWVDPVAGGDGIPIFISSEVASWHCSADADSIFNGAKPTGEILTRFSDFNVEVIDDSVSGARIFRWDRDGLKFELRALSIANNYYEVLAVAKGQAPRSTQIEDHLALVRENLQDLKEPRRYNCIHTFWRFVFSVLMGVVVAGVPAIIIGSVIAVGLGLGSLAGLFAFSMFIAGCYLFNLWLSQRTRDFLNKHWSQLFRQGDHEGTVRRALASIGVPLPNENTTQ